jgi:hypothetical protein
MFGLMSRAIITPKTISHKPKLRFHKEMIIHPKSKTRPIDVILVNQDHVKNTMQVRGQQLAEEFLFSDGTRLVVDYTQHLVLKCRFADQHKNPSKNYIMP